ncbi:13819_t:CDS:1 [Funneliformis geosporum]|uniref:11900_t:CDS:1 n=1 Tax=Funneliformis geosporum TaxID=1117311 RepID=A0A9W4SU45_9GLOM|nr:13819_t:CDS:1 [Funneliformis geosporum]CAI2181665.1 11900_t:CDS:1 [Funneliformis geosporum]
MNYSRSINSFNSFNSFKLHRTLEFVVTNFCRLPARNLSYRHSETSRSKNFGEEKYKYIGKINNQGTNKNQRKLTQTKPTREIYNQRAEQDRSKLNKTESFGKFHNQADQKKFTRTESIHNKGEQNNLTKTESIEKINNQEADQNRQLKIISVHVPRHRKPLTDAEFGYYLAGLIDGKGTFTSNGEFQMLFHEFDSSLAYFIKGKIGFGRIRKNEIDINEKSTIYFVSRLDAMSRIATLINGKCRTDKVEIFNEIILPRINKESENPIPALTRDANLQDQNFWMAGFSDANGFFKIKIMNKIRSGNDIKLEFQVEQEDGYGLTSFKDAFGGYIRYGNPCYYNSVDFGPAYKIINYFDHFHLNSTEHINYLKWRKVYCLMMEEGHLTERGRARIEKLCKSLTAYP